MISREQNELMTRVGPDTPGGKLLRNYWQPVALVDEFDGVRDVKAVQVLGERFVLFRNKDGNSGSSIAIAPTARPISPTGAGKTAT